MDKGIEVTTATPKQADMIYTKYYDRVPKPDWFCQGCVFRNSEEGKCEVINHNPDCCSDGDPYIYIEKTNEEEPKLNNPNDSEA